MNNFFIFLTTILLFVSCGKSPLSMKVSTEQNQLSEIENTLYLQSTGQSATLKWHNPLNSTGENKATLKIKKHNLPEDIIGHFNIFLWMPSMGHGSSPITITHTATGLYELEDIYFIMDGDWSLKIQLINNNSTDEISFNYIIK